MFLNSPNWFAYLVFSEDFYYPLNGTLTITSRTMNRISGTFEATLLDDKTGIIIEVTDGFFDIPFGSNDY